MAALRPPLPPTPGLACPLHLTRHEVFLRAGEPRAGRAPLAPTCQRCAYTTETLSDELYSSSAARTSCCTAWRGVDPTFFACR